MADLPCYLLLENIDFGDFSTSVSDLNPSGWKFSRAPVFLSHTDIIGIFVFYIISGDVTEGDSPMWNPTQNLQFFSAFMVTKKGPLS